jgi:hypothetical protein
MGCKLLDIGQEPERISAPYVVKIKHCVAYIILNAENYKWREEATCDKLTSFHKETAVKDCK